MSNGDTTIKTNNGDSMAVFKKNNAVELYYDNTKRFETTTTGVKTLGDLSIRNSSNTQHILYDESESALEFIDNIKATFGAGNDLQIYHNGSKSFITNTGSTALEIEALAGDLVLRGTDNVYLQSGTTDETFFKGTVNGAAELYYDNSKKLETTSAGITVNNVDLSSSTGRIRWPEHSNTASRAWDLIGEQGAYGKMELKYGGADGATPDEISWRAIVNGAVQLYYDNSQKLATKSDGIDVTGEVQCDSLDVDGNGDIAGTLTTNRVVISDNGSSSPLLSVRADDDNPWAFVVGNDSYSTADTGLRVYQNNNGDVYTQARGNSAYVNWNLTSSNGTTSPTMIQFDTSRAVHLKYQGNTKLSTTSSGVDITGACEASEQMRINNANASIYFGTTAGGYGPNSAIGRAQVSNYHASGSAVGDLVIGAERQKNIIFGTTTSSSGGLSGRCRITNAGHFVPVNNNNFDLGTSSLRWRNIYTNDLNLSNEGGGNDVDGTWGNYTIQEGENDLYLINRRNGKKYKFNLTEVN